MIRFLKTCCLITLSAFLVACAGSSNSPGTDASSSTSVADSPLEPVVPAYEATLRQGIDFKKPGYPNLLVGVAGVSGVEPFGRWTDATLSPTVRFRFKDPLPAKFILELQANSYGPNDQEPTRIRAGNVEKTVLIKSQPETLSIPFENVSGDLIEIIPPKPVAPIDVDPRSQDTRKVAIALASMKLLE
jgi:phosphoglycerol transferase